MKSSYFRKKSLFYILGDIRKSKWSIYRRKDNMKIASFSNEIEAYNARRYLIDFNSLK